MALHTGMQSGKVEFPAQLIDGARCFQPCSHISGFMHSPGVITLPVDNMASHGIRRLGLADPCPFDGSEQIIDRSGPRKTQQADEVGVKVNVVLRTQHPPMVLKTVLDDSGFQNQSSHEAGDPETEPTLCVRTPERQSSSRKTDCLEC